MRTEPSGRSVQFLGLDGGAVGDLLMGLHEDLLADDLGGQEAVRDVGKVVVGVEVRARGHGGGEFVEKAVQPVAVGGGHHEGLLGRQGLAHGGSERQQVLTLDQVDLVEHEPDPAVALAEVGGDLADVLGGPCPAIDDQEREIGVFGAGPGGFDHGAVEFALGLEDAGGIDQQDLGGVRA